MAFISAAVSPVGFSALSICSIHSSPNHEAAVWRCKRYKLLWNWFNVEFMSWPNVRGSWRIWRYLLVIFLHLYCRGTIISYLEFSSAVFLLHGRCISLGHLPSYLRRFLLPCHALQPLQQPFLLDCYSSVHTRILTYKTPPHLLHVTVRPLPQLPRPRLLRPRLQPHLQPFSVP